MTLIDQVTQEVNEVMGMIDESQLDQADRKSVV